MVRPRPIQHKQLRWSDSKLASSQEVVIYFWKYKWIPPSETTVREYFRNWNAPTWNCAENSHHFFTWPRDFQRKNFISLHIALRKVRFLYGTGSGWFLCVTLEGISSYSLVCWVGFYDRCVLLFCAWNAISSMVLK